MPALTAAEYRLAVDALNAGATNLEASAAACRSYKADDGAAQRESLAAAYRNLATKLALRGP